MLVTHATDHITHAVIGGKKAINYGISDDPAFFQILSGALYKDPILAMVRETICNAWDAHIDGDLTDRPIVVTLTDEYISIQDFGKGIPDDMIGPIYAIYGASTKKKDVRQTGGFGLGCKSPFSYTDHFEVTSCHQGFKTIYAMSKSSAAVEGKPSITPIATFATTETGITVKIPLNPSKQNHRLPGLVEQVVLNGDIHAKFNGDLLPKLGLDASEHGMVLIPRDTNLVSLGHLKHDIQIRYGNVIYPVEKAPEYSAMYEKVSGLLASYYNCRLVMLAPPDSVSITPSREHVTLSDTSTTTINNLFGKFFGVFSKNQQLLFRHKEMVNEFVDKAATEKGELRDRLPLGNWAIPGVPSDVGNSVLATTEQFAKLEVLMRYSGKRNRIKGGVWFKFIRRYLHKMNEEELFDRGLLQSWARTMQRNLKIITGNDDRYYRGARHEIRIATTWWAKNVLFPLTKRITGQLPEFDLKKLHYLSFHSREQSYYNTPDLARANATQITNHTQNLIHLITPTVVLTHNASSFLKRTRGAGISKMGTGTIQSNCYFVYEVSRKKGELEATLEAFKKVPGIELLDLTGRLAHEQEAYDARQAQVEQARIDKAAGRVPKIKLDKKIKPGLVRLDVLLEEPNKRINTTVFTENLDPTRIVAPKAVLLISTAKNKHHETDRLTPKMAYAVAKLFGEEIGVSNKSDAIARAIHEKGAMELCDYLYDKIVSDVQTSPTLVTHHSCCPTKIDNYIEEKAGWENRGSIRALVRMLMEYPELNHLAPDIEVLSEEDRLRWFLWENMAHLMSYDKREELKKVQKTVGDVPLKTEVIKFLDQLITNQFLGLIDLDGTKKLMRQTAKEPVAHAKLISLITTILT